MRPTKSIVLNVTTGLLLLMAALTAAAGDYPVVDTGQEQCYDALHEIAAPAEGGAFYGQDAQYDGNQPSYTLSGDVLTVPDNVTGLTPSPNPFRSEATLTLALPSDPGEITCRLYDTSGRLLSTLEPTGSDGGLTEFVWDGTSRDGSAVASGVYFARVLGDDGVSEARLVKLR